MQKIKRSGSKGQIFSLDVLVSLVPIILLLGASLQYLYEVQEKTRFVAEDYELELISRSAINYVVTKSENVLDCAQYASDVDTILGDNYEYYISANYYESETSPGDRPGAKRSCPGVNMWSSRLDVDSLYGNRQTAASWKRFVLGSYEGQISPGNITEVSIAVWETREWTGE